MKSHLSTAAVAGFAFYTSLALAQTTTMSTSTVSQRPVMTQTVQVGLQHAFVPDTIIAIPGDTIKFEFNPTNHSVVKADFGDPCVPFDYHRRDEPMFYSGQKISKTGDEKPVWTMKVYDTNPTFFYCSAPGSCLVWKMIGVINPNSTWSLENQLKFHANTTKFQLSPGDPYPEESPSIKTTTTPASSSPTTTPTTAPDNGGGASAALSPGAIAGISIGGAAVLVLAAALFWFCGHRKGIELGVRHSVPPASLAEDPHFTDRKSPAFQSSVHYPSGVPSQNDPYRSTSPGQWSHSQHQMNQHASLLGQSGGSLSSPTFAPGNSPRPRQTQQDTISPYQDNYERDSPNPSEHMRTERPIQVNNRPSELDSTPYQAQFSPEQHQFPPEQTQYPPEQNQYPREQNQYPREQNQYPREQGQILREHSQQLREHNLYQREQGQLPREHNQYPRERNLSSQWPDN